MSISKLFLERLAAAERGEKINFDDVSVPELERCDATAKRWVDERDARDRAEQQQRVAAEMRDPAIGKFPERLVRAALAVWPKDSSAMRHAREYLLGRKQVLVLAGGVGVGKSSAATWLALEAGGSSPGFIRASTLERRGRYSKGLDTWLESRSMLVIDDLGAEVLDSHGVFRSLLDETIDTFYGRGARVVVTTNLHAQRATVDGDPQFLERYGERVASRLAEVGVWASCGARDLRRSQLEIVEGGQRS